MRVQTQQSRFKYLHKTCAHYDDSLDNSRKQQKRLNYCKVIAVLIKFAIIAIFAWIHKKAQREFLAGKKKERSFRRPSSIALARNFSWNCTKKKVEKYLTIYLQCPTLHDHKTTLALQRSSILSPLYFGRRRSSCSTRKHCHAPFREGLICWPNLNDGGRNVIHWYDLNFRKREIEREEEWLIWINISFMELEFCFHSGERENIWVAMSSLSYQFVYLVWINSG